MSQYKFKRNKVSAAEQEKPKIMNANASPEENTAIFKPTSVENPFVDDDAEEYNIEDDVFLPKNISSENTKKRKEDEGKKKKQVSLFKTFSKHTLDSEDEDFIDSDEADILAKAEDIINGKDVSVDKLKESLSGDGKVNLADVFSTKKTEDEVTKKSEPVEAESSELPEESITENGVVIEDEEDVFEDNETDAEEEESDIYVDTPDVPEDIDLPPKPKKQKKVKEALEFKPSDDKEDFFDRYRKKEKVSILALIFSVISLLVLIYIETKSLPHPEWLMPGKFGFLYLMFDLQFVFISGICVASAIKNGAINLFTWKPSKESVTFITFTVSVIQILFHLIFNKYSKDISLYSSVFAVCATVTTLISYIDTKREYTAFKIAASSKTKTTVTVLADNSVESSSFSEFLPENVSMYKITKTSFLGDFYKTVSNDSIYNDNYKISIPLVFVASLVFAILSFVLAKGSGICDVINTFSLTFMMALPISSLFVVSLPFFVTSLILSKSRSAIIGESSIEEFANAPLVSFADTDIFNPKGITISSIKTYGKTRIDNTYLYAAKVFKMVGGPLEEVFDRSVINLDKNDNSNSILSITENGINAVVDSVSVILGNDNHMVANGLNPIEDSTDKEYVNTTCGKILYVAVDGEISAKFYIKYVLGAKFKKLLDSFSSLGICVAVNTCDPNLDTDFLLKILKDKSYPIVAVKNTDIPTEDSKKPVEQASGGIVSTSSIYDVLRTFIAADKLSHIIYINMLTKYISLILAFTLIVVAFLTEGSHEKITPLFIILYQVIWSLPVIGTSIFR